MTLKKILLSSFFIFLILGHISLNIILEASTSSPPTISVYPGRTYVQIKPGRIYRGFFLITNKSDELIKVKVLAEDWTLMGQGKYGDPKAWIRFPTKEFKISPRKEYRITYRIKFLRNISGEKMAQIFFEPSRASGEGSFIVTRTGVLVIAVAKGTEKLQLGNLAIKRIAGENPENAKIELQIANLGNVHAQWNAEVKIIDSKEIEVGRANIKSTQSLLTGESKRFLGTVENYNALGSEDLKAKITLNYGIENNSEKKEEFLVPVE
jgi:hypothetical protein